MRFFVRISAITLMLACGVMALPSQSFETVSAAEAATVKGGDGCVSHGAAVNHCCSCYCWHWGLNTNDGNLAVNEEGNASILELGCPCDTSITQTVARGSCDPAPWPMPKIYGL